MCNELIKACCPEGHFGQDCVPCIGYPDNICNNRGYCLGNGTRSGNGKCICFKEYSGEVCDQCAKNYFPNGIIEKVLAEQKFDLPEKCEKCDQSCSTCYSNGSKSCNSCRTGYHWDDVHGCVDVNECSSLETNTCKENTYCNNIVGSYKCQRK